MCLESGTTTSYKGERTAMVVARRGFTGQVGGGVKPYSYDLVIPPSDAVIGETTGAVGPKTLRYSVLISQQLDGLSFF